MYHQHSQQQGQQPLSNGPRPPHHQPPSNQHQNHPNMQPMGFQFSRPTQLPDELESALAVRATRDMDHRQIDHINRPNQHQNQGSSSGISQHGGYGSNPMPLSTDNQPGVGVDWSSYQAPAKLFASSPLTVNQQSQQHHRPQSSQGEIRVPNWTSPANDSPSPQTRHPHSGGEGQNLYTPESAGSILASFGLSNEDLEVLSHYPDDQLTPDTLPFILRDIQINKSGNQKSEDSTSTSSFSRSIHDAVLPPDSTSPMTRSGSPEVPSLLTVTQTAGKVIDYGHASRAKADTDVRGTYKRDLLSNERTGKMYPASSSSADKPERRQVHLEPTEPSKHGDRDYRRTSSDQHKSSRSPRREFPLLPKSRNLDKDYRHEGPKPRLSSESRSEASSRRSLSSSSGSKPHSGSKKLPTPTMISDFSAVSPKVYPHTCSLCNIQCDQEKDWVDHVNTVNHTAACRELRTKYPNWKSKLPSRSGRFGSQALWNQKDDSPSRSTPQSPSRSPSPSFSQSKHRVAPQSHRPHARFYSPHHHPRHYNYTERRHRFEHHHAGSHSPPHSQRISSNRWLERTDKTLAGARHSGMKRPHDRSVSPSPTDGHSWTKGLKIMTKTTGIKTTKMSAKPPPAKKKKKLVTSASPGPGRCVAERLVYLSGIPNEASEQEVTDLVRSFGKINNVILMPSSEEESEEAEGQEASVCMMKAEDAKALATSTTLSIREQLITATVAKKPEEGHLSHANSSKLIPGQDKPESDCGHQKTSDKKCLVLITGLPESGWTESDILSLFQPNETPSDIIRATQIGKALVSVSDVEVAEEIVKVHSFMPAKIKDSEVKMVLLKQQIGFSTPVALYNLLMGSVDPLESQVRVGWSSLLVISNVPDTPSDSSKVQKLVQRFGTVINTLVLNNMVICEMATPTTAWSVLKRFQIFPCVIQRNPLFFSRMADPKANTEAKVISAYLDSSEDTPANDRDSEMTAAADEEKMTCKGNSVAPLEEVENGGDEKINSTDKTIEDEDLEGKDANMKSDETILCDSSTAVEADPVSVSEASTVMEAVDKDKSISAAQAGDDKTSAGERPTACSFDGEAALPPLPKMTQAMVNALLEECRTRTANNPSNTAVPPSEEQVEVPMETEQSKKAAEEIKVQAKSQTERGGEGVKKQERENKLKDATKEKEPREREKLERERRPSEKEEKPKRGRLRAEKFRKERERKDEERREWERKEREKRQRKRSYGESLSGSRSSCRLEGYRQSSWRDEQDIMESETKTEQEEEDFLFNMTDFVTLDEVGDVTDFPSSPPSTVPMETSEERKSAPTCVHQDPPVDTCIDGTESLVNSKENLSDPEYASASTAETSDCLMFPDQTTSLLVSAAASPPEPSLVHLFPSQSEAPQADATPQPDCTLIAIPDSTPAPEPLPKLVNSSNIPERCGVTTEKVKAEKDNNLRNHSQAEKEKDGEMVPNKQKAENEMQDEKETKNEAAEKEKQESSEDNVSNTKEESVKTTTKMETPKIANPSPPSFDPSSPVGMEFLVPKTGFFCKVCKRFFSGAKEAEINHCKTLKHYENLQAHLKTIKATT